MADYFTFKPVPGIDDPPPAPREEIIDDMLKQINERLKSLVTRTLKDSAQVDAEALKKPTGPQSDDANAKGLAALNRLKGIRKPGAPEPVSPELTETRNPDDGLGDLPIHQLVQMQKLLRDAAGQSALEPDGIVGPGTWTSIRPQRDTAANEQQYFTIPLENASISSIDPNSRNDSFFDGRFLSARDLTREDSPAEEVAVHFNPREFTLNKSNEWEQDGRDVDKPFLMPVEDVFSITGRGTAGTTPVDPISLNFDRVTSHSPRGGSWTIPEIDDEVLVGFVPGEFRPRNTNGHVSKIDSFSLKQTVKSNDSNDRFNGKYLVASARHQYDKVVVHGWNPFQKVQITGEADSAAQRIPGSLEYPNIAFHVPETDGHEPNPLTASFGSTEATSMKFTMFLNDGTPVRSQSGSADDRFSFAGEMPPSGSSAIHTEQLNNKYPENMKHEVREHVGDYGRVKTKFSWDRGTSTAPYVPGGTSISAALSRVDAGPRRRRTVDDSFGGILSTGVGGYGGVLTQDRILSVGSEPTNRLRPYIIQRNESDLSFIEQVKLKLVQTPEFANGQGANTTYNKWITHKLRRRHVRSRMGIHAQYDMASSITHNDSASNSSAHGMHFPLRPGVEVLQGRQSPQPVPSGLPGARVISGLKSHSSIGGGGSNDASNDFRFIKSRGGHSMSHKLFVGGLSWGTDDSPQGSAAAGQNRPPMTQFVWGSFTSFPSVNSSQAVDNQGRYGDRLTFDRLQSTSRGAGTGYNQSDLDFVKRLAARNGFGPSVGTSSHGEFFDALITETTFPAGDASPSRINEPLMGNYNFRLEISGANSPFLPRSFDVKIEGKNVPGGASAMLRRLANPHLPAGNSSDPTLPAHELTHTFQQTSGVGTHGYSSDDTASLWLRLQQQNTSGSAGSQTIIGGFKNMSGMDSQTAAADSGAGGYPTPLRIQRDAEKGTGGAPDPFSTVDGLRVPDPAAGVQPRPASPPGVPIPYPVITQTDTPSGYGDPDRPIITGAVPNPVTPSNNAYEGWPSMWRVPASDASRSSDHSSLWIRTTQPHTTGGLRKPFVIGGLWNGQDQAPESGRRLHAQYDMDSTIEHSASSPFAILTNQFGSAKAGGRGQ